MELIRYQKTLDVHKNGSQFLLQGFQTADNMSRVIEISLMASGDAIDFPLEKVEALMYVTTPNATEPSINKCTIKDNKVVYDVLPIVEEGITTMRLKIIETSTNGATGVIASPEFSVEVSKSFADDSAAKQTTTFTALEDAVAKAKTVYDKRFLRMELTNDCIFRAYYADGTVYETDILKKLFNNGNVLLSESYAHGGTGVRAGEDTDNSMYYSKVSKSESLNAKNIMKNSEEILEEVKLHGMYTAFSVDFETGKVEYVSPSFKFKVNTETGDLDAIGQSYTFDEEIGRVVEHWLATNKIVLSDLQAISETHTDEIGHLKELTETHTEDIDGLKSEDESLGTRINELKDRVTPIELGGTGVKSLGEMKSLLTIDKIAPLSSYLMLASSSNTDVINAALGMNNEDDVIGIGKALAMYAKFKDSTIDIDATFPELIKHDRLREFDSLIVEEIMSNDDLKSLFDSNNFMYNSLIPATAKNIIYDRNTPSTELPDFGFAYKLSGTYDLKVGYHQSGTKLYLQNDTGVIGEDSYCTVPGATVYQTNGAKYLNIGINYVSSTASGNDYARFGILNSDGNTLGKYISGIKSGRFSIDVSDLSEIRFGFMLPLPKSAQFLGFDYIILSDYQIV